MNIDKFKIDKISKIEIWDKTPICQKLDYLYCAKLFFGSLLGSHDLAKELESYLEQRKENNEKYKKFWSDTTNIRFNKNKKEYLIAELKSDK